jgi:hypothetical protein
MCMVQPRLLQKQKRHKQTCLCCPDAMLPEGPASDFLYPSAPGPGWAEVWLTAFHPALPTTHFTLGLCVRQRLECDDTIAGDGLVWLLHDSPTSPQPSSLTPLPTFIKQLLTHAAFCLPSFCPLRSGNNGQILSPRPLSQALDPCILLPPDTCGDFPGASYSPDFLSKCEF